MRPSVYYSESGIDRAHACAFTKVSYRLLVQPTHSAKLIFCCAVVLSHSERSVQHALIMGSVILGGKHPARVGGWVMAPLQVTRCFAWDRCQHINAASHGGQLTHPRRRFANFALLSPPSALRFICARLFPYLMWS